VPVANPEAGRDDDEIASLGERLPHPEVALKVATAPMKEDDAR